MGEAVRADCHQGMRGEGAGLFPGHELWFGERCAGDVGLSRKLGDRIEQLRLRPQPQRPIDPLEGGGFFARGSGGEARQPADLDGVEPADRFL